MRLCVVIVAAAVWTGGPAQAGAEAPRLLGGQPLGGEVLAVRPDGIEMVAAGGGKLYPWSAFSPATRFRYDPLYRANLALAQQGLAVRAWTNAAEGGYSAAPVKEQAAAPSPVAADIQPLSFAGLPAPAALPRAALVGLNVRNDARAIAWGFQFGPGPADAVYYVMEPAGEDGLPNTLWMWTDPGRGPEALQGSRRSDGGDTTVSFRRQRFQSRMEDADIRFDLAVSASTRDRNALSIALDVEIRKDGAVSTFTLLGSPPGALVGDGNLVARDLLAPPALKIGVELQEGKPVLAGAIRMGRLTLLPGMNMQKGVNVVIQDGRPAKVFEELVPVKEDAARSRAALLLPLDRLAPGQKYALQASADLGPLVGPLRYEESFVRP